MVASFMSVVRASPPVRSAFACPVRMSSAVVPPTSGWKISFDSPNVPWHCWHFASHTFCPSATLPCPGGSPLKSGRTSMSQAAISAGVAARPMPGNVVPAAVGAASSASVIPAHPRMQRSINLHIGHLAGFGHLPRLDRVVVVDRTRAANGAQLVDLGLDVAGVVDRTRLQHGGG